MQTLIIFLSLCFFLTFLFGLFYLVDIYSTPIEYESYVTKYCFQYGVDANLVFATIKTESNFNEKAVSKKGALGLMQLMPQTVQYLCFLMDCEYADVQLFDPETNIKFGVYYLSYLSKKFEGKDLQIVAYNAGEGNVKRWLTEFGEEGKLNYIPYEESRQYLKKVNRYYDMYNARYNY